MSLVAVADDPLLCVSEIAALALHLGDALEKEYRTWQESRSVGNRWQHFAPQFSKLQQAVIELGDLGGRAPAGCERVVEQLRVLRKLCQRIDKQTTVDGIDHALGFWPNLKTAAAQLLDALKQAERARKIGEGMARAKDPSPTIDAGIDTTPQAPCPPDELIANAQRDVVSILADEPIRDGRSVMQANVLAGRIQQCGHILAAAQWAIHRLVQERRLTVERVGGWEFVTPGPLSGARIYAVIPQHSQTPYDRFQVVATPMLWTWAGWNKSETEAIDGAGELEAVDAAPVGISERNRDIKQAPVDRKPATKKPFTGGTITIYRNRIELFGVAIYCGPRSKRMRKVLELLGKRRGKVFVEYSAKVLAEKAGVKETSVAGLIRDLRDQLKVALEKSGFDCGRFDIILSRGPGYRLSDKLSVQLAAESASQRGANTGGTLSGTATGRVSGTVMERRAKILQVLMDGHQRRLPAIAAHFSCPKRTVRRDLDALRAAGKVEFVGAAKTGFYVVCQTLAHAQKLPSQATDNLATRDATMVSALEDKAASR